MEDVCIVTRRDLKPGLQLAQSCHALQAFNDQHPELARSWKGNLVALATDSASSLGALATDLGRQFRVAVFHEPDLDGVLTAIAVEGSARSLLSSLPLALRDVHV